MIIKDKVSLVAHLCLAQVRVAVPCHDQIWPVRRYYGEMECNKVIIGNVCLVVSYTARE